MRIFEILILVTLFVRLVGGAFPSVKRSRFLNLTPSIAVLFTVVHLILENYRLQMVPAYGLTLLFFVLSIRRVKGGRRSQDIQSPHWVVIAITLFFKLLIISIVAALPILVPVFRLPSPSGAYQVGTTELYLVDYSRPETLSANPDNHREFMVRVWYPAQVEPGSRPAPLMEHMPLQFSHLSLVQTHAYQDAPVSSAQASYPVLIFSHGHVGFVEQNLTQFEELASHGYIVCSIAHTYHAVATVFPDGRVVPADPDLANDFLKGNSPNHNVNAEHLRIWVDDTRFLMDELENIQRGAGESLLAGKLDMTRLGIFGQSFGGVTAVQVCSVDDRCQAGINMDGGLPGDYATGVISSRSIQPFMFMFNEGRANYVRTTLGRLTNTAYGITVRGTTHFDFTTFPCTRLC